MVVNHFPKSRTSLLAHSTQKHVMMTKCRTLGAQTTRQFTSTRALAYGKKWRRRSGWRVVKEGKD